MPIKTILVHLNHDDRAHMCLETAVQIAHGNRAHIVALYVTTPMGLGKTVAGRGASAVYVEEARASAHRHAAEVRTHFNMVCDQKEVTHDWVVADGEHIDELKRHAHVADLAIVRQTERQHLEDHVVAQLPDALVHLVGCPVMMLPIDPEEKIPARHALVAWKPMIPTVRALRGAVPILEQTGKVTIMTIGDTAADVPGAEVQAFLGRHGIEADIIEVPGRDGSAGKLILETADRLGADLIVMGSQSRSVLSKLVFGSATGYVQRHAKALILTSH